MTKNKKLIITLSKAFAPFMPKSNKKWATGWNTINGIKRAAKSGNPYAKSILTALKIS